ncbi:MAG: hypothetical protein ACOWWM_11995 [Desulfobacterales bacterium]
MKYDRLMMLLLGVGVGVCLWILIGLFFNTERAATRYQVSTFSSASESPTGTRGWWGYVIIDTGTGKVIEEKVHHKGYQ